MDKFKLEKYTRTARYGKETRIFGLQLMRIIRIRLSNIRESKSTSAAYVPQQFKSAPDMSFTPNKLPIPSLPNNCSGSLRATPNISS
ncbi:hypothetical protein HYC85_016255 [Camellia sinensis]|uniref:Uncharacterized protein n=1 Tax=Camellia sinensis TaxID=4442 RepID=A0A7J7H0A2_CAMSI|nr:hypothetical protein HYC85_016255 [Camellia sinensis]